MMRKCLWKRLWPPYAELRLSSAVHQIVMGGPLVEPIFATVVAFYMSSKPRFLISAEMVTMNHRVDFERHKAERVDRLGMLPVRILEGCSIIQGP